MAAPLVNSLLPRLPTGSTPGTIAGMVTTEAQSHRPTVLITGATDGIGLALARRYHADQARLILVGRRPLAELDPALFSTDTYCQVDLATVDAAERVAVWLELANIRRLDRVYLNAAVGYVGDLGAQAPHAIEEMVRINLWTPIALVHRLAPIVAPQKGQFVFVSSVTAAMPTPDYAVYSATKAALEGFVRNLRIELRAQRSPIRITLVRPGATHTGMHAKSGVDPMRMDWTQFPPAETTAGALQRAAHRNRRIANLGAANSLIHWAGRNASGLITAALRRRLPPAAAQPPAITDATPPVVKFSAPPARIANPKTHVVITGGATGIGAAIAQAYATADSILTLIDIDAATAAETAAKLRTSGAQINVIQANLGTSAGCCHVLDTLRAYPPITVLVNNAGISSVGPFLTSDLAAQQRVVALNFVAPLLLTAGALRESLLAPGAGLVYLASLSHYVSYPGAAVYAATKDGLVSLAKSLRAAAHPADRHVLTVYPGPTRTDHAARYSPDNSRAHRRMPPQVVAAAIKQAVEHRQETLIPGLANRLTAAAARLAPPLIESIMTRALFTPLAARSVAPDSTSRMLP